MSKTYQHLDSEAAACFAQGLALQETKQYQAALLSYQQAIAVQPNYPEAFVKHGNILRLLGQPQSALDSYQQAITLKPDYAAGHFGLGNALLGLRQYQAAVSSYDSAILLQPDSAEAHNNRGIALQNLRQYAAALDSFARAIALKPDFESVYNNRGLTFNALQRYDEELASYQRAIELNPKFFEAYNNRGNALQKLQRFSDAVLSYQRAIALKPDHAKAYFNRGLAYKNLNRYEEALADFQQVTGLKPDYAEAYNNCGLALNELKRFAAALQNFEQAIALKPDYAEAYNNRGLALEKLNHYAAALASYEQAIALKTDFAIAMNNRGNVQRLLKQYSAAAASFEEALVLVPDYASAHWNKALLKLLQGDYAEGWRLYEWRWQDAQQGQLANYPQPLWLGEQPVQDKTVLIYPEQGLGDFIQFCRYLPMLAALGAKVIAVAPRPLLSLLKTLPEKISWLAPDEPLPPFDLHCPLMSLPLAFNTTMATIPAKLPYLFADRDKLLQWQQRLGSKNRPRIGLAWSGTLVDPNRSIPLEILIDLLALPLEFHSLQKELKADDVKLLTRFPQLRSHQHELHDFAETAALIEAMDLVISIDTSVAHLAGAMAKPVWILLPYAADFRWLTERTDCPWYSTAVLWRQAAINDWRSVIADIGKKLVATKFIRE